MAKHARQWALLSLALALLPLCLAACQAPSSQGMARTIVVSTAVGGTASAVPTFTPLTIGVWASAAAPDAHDGHHGGHHSTTTYTIYVLCMLHDPSLGGVLGPAKGLQVRVRLSGSITGSYTGTTGSDGLAQVRVSFTDAQPNKPVSVVVATMWHGVTYQGQTFLMLGNEVTPTPSPSPSRTPAPSPSPTTGPSPTPAATADPSPTITQGAIATISR